MAELIKLLLYQCRTNAQINFLKFTNFLLKNSHKLRKLFYYFPDLLEHIYVVFCDCNIWSSSLVRNVDIVRQQVKKDSVQFTESNNTDWKQIGHPSGSLIK